MTDQQGVGPTPDNTAAAILAGGLARRMGGVDKGLQLFHGAALIEHAIHRLKKQTFGTPGLIGLNANRNQQQYAQWGLPVWSDLNQDFAGPLAGFQAALGHCRSNAPHIAYLLMIPCDSPLFPLDLLSRMSDGLMAAGADVAVAVGREDGASNTQEVRRQPVFCLMRTSVLESLTAYLAQGGRKIDTWMDTCKTVDIPFDQPTDRVDAFFNANTLAQLQHPASP